MDGIVALGHFCETHGPCIILCTQRCKNKPQQLPHNLTVPWCKSCQSVDLDQSLVSKDIDIYYVSTRTPLQQNLAFLLKQAAVRSLSCEECSKEGGTIYFGDNERGHVISHTFTLQDSLARGFHRKYTILILSNDKIHLLNNWHFLTKNIKRIATNLQIIASNINGFEQTKCYQRAVRQAQNSPTTPPARSLSQLTGQPAIFAHLHMWFTWLLHTEIIVEKSIKISTIPISFSSQSLKNIYHEMDFMVFRIIFYCILTGLRIIDVNNTNVINIFKQFLPINFKLPKNGEMCRFIKNSNNKWIVEWSGTLPIKLPQLLTITENALNNDEFSDDALDTLG